MKFARTVTLDVSAGSTNAYRSVLSATGSFEIAGASRWEDIEDHPCAYPRIRDAAPSAYFVMCNSSCYNRRAARRSARRCRIPRIASTVNPESDLGKGSYVPYHVADGIPRGVMLMHRAWILGLVLFAVFLSAP